MKRQSKVKRKLKDSKDYIKKRNVVENESDIEKNQENSDKKSPIIIRKYTRKNNKNNKKNKEKNEEKNKDTEFIITKPKRFYDYVTNLKKRKEKVIADNKINDNIQKNDKYDNQNIRKSNNIGKIVKDEKKLNENDNENNNNDDIFFNSSNNFFGLSKVSLKAAF